MERAVIFSSVNTSARKGESMTVLEDLRAMEQRVTARIEELRPALEEYRELEAAARRLGLDVSAATKSPSARRGGRATKTAKPASRSAAKSPTRTKSRTRRVASARTKSASSRRVQRRDQVLELIKDRPGISVPDIGKELGVDPTGLYRVVRQLQTEGAVKKEGMTLQVA